MGHGSTQTPCESSPRDARVASNGVAGRLWSKTSGLPRLQGLARDRRPEGGTPSEETGMLIGRRLRSRRGWHEVPPPSGCVTDDIPPRLGYAPPRPFVLATWVLRAAEV